MSEAPCGCPWDGTGCPHCGMGLSDWHILRHHDAAVGYSTRMPEEDQP